MFTTHFARLTTTGTAAAELAAFERETNNPNLAAWTDADFDDSDEAFERNMAECQAFAASVRA
jgi:hypothetical protein